MKKRKPKRKLRKRLGLLYALANPRWFVQANGLVGRTRTSKWITGIDKDYCPRAIMLFDNGVRLCYATKKGLSLEV